MLNRRVVCVQKLERPESYAMSMETGRQGGQL